ncbi:hypothetical protein [Maritimibacter sp. HL-12]|uniref:hypothetical protein n=1 Tax=Maritimibacter sp. HL-12 TaxID=1162418 RepID=UPI000A0F3985|nr:hypothetical protein [Maritimibacter sp. HL-12]SMH57510.1 hypothetical protein SAMN05661107_3425 [Maritimibacter sp. HL-12]
MVTRNPQGRLGGGAPRGASDESPRSDAADGGKTQFRPQSGQDTTTPGQARPPSHAPPVLAEGAETSAAADDAAQQGQAAEAPAGSRTTGTDVQPRPSPRTDWSGPLGREVGLMIAILGILAVLSVLFLLTF